ncbi:MAG: rubredoxin [Proteobacteria bacterium]|nr:rubredoxin [Pseudomonadota bacterium]MBU1648521.1 rubredoxin [Pseudomonadota bacterium]
MASPEEMYQCQTVNCGYVYDPDRGDRKGKIAKGTQFKDLPDDWRCPVCGATKKAFRPLAGPGSVHAENAKAQEAFEQSPGSKSKMQKYRCNICGYVYDPEVGEPAAGIAPGTSYEDLPDSYECPVCGAAKDDFTAI